MAAGGSSSSSSPQVNILHLRLIEFITTNNRLFKCEWPSIWSEFFFEFPQHEDLSTDSIRKEFFENVLPQVFNFELTPRNERYIRLLDEYPGLIRTEFGYKLRSTEEMLQEKMDNVINSVEDLTAIDIPNKNTFDQIRQEITSDPSVHAWSSALVSSKAEFDNEILLPYDEIKRRFLRIRETGAVEDSFNFENVLGRVERNVEFKKELQKRITKAYNDLRKRKRPGQ